MIHPDLLIDNKHSSRTHASCSELREIRKRAEVEKKIGILTLTEKGKHGWHYVIHSDDLARFIRVVAKDLDFTQGAVSDGTVLEGTTLYIGPPVGNGTVETIGDAIQEEKKTIRTTLTLHKRKAAKKKPVVVSSKKSKPAPVASSSADSSSGSSSAPG